MDDPTSIPPSAADGEQAAVTTPNDSVRLSEENIQLAAQVCDSLTKSASVERALLEAWRYQDPDKPVGYWCAHPDLVQMFKATFLDLAETLEEVQGFIGKFDFAVGLAADWESTFELAADMLMECCEDLDMLLDDHSSVTLLFMAEKDWNVAGKVLVSKVQAHLEAQGTAADSRLRFMVAVYLGNVDEVAALLSKTPGIDSAGRNVAVRNIGLFLAVERQDAAMVQTLLDAGVDINATDSKDQTALFRATRRQDATMMKLLISAGIEIDSRDDKGCTAWSANVGSRNHETLDILLIAGADPSVRGLQGVSPLYQAASDGDTDLVRFLLESGTDPSIQTEYQWAPIHWAAAYGHEDCLELLIDVGADVNVKSDQGVTPWDLAMQKNQTGILRKLKEAGAVQQSEASSQKGLTLAVPGQHHRIEPPLRTPVTAAPSSPLRHKLFLVADNPLSRTLIKRTNWGQFLYPRVQQDCPQPPAGYIYQVSHVMETTSTTISIRRAVRRAEMDEYPLQLDDFNFDDVLYQITSLNPNYQEFELKKGGQHAQYDALEQQQQSNTETDTDTSPPSKSYSYRMSKELGGDWVVSMDFSRPISSDEPAPVSLFRIIPDPSPKTAQTQSNDNHWHMQDCRWITTYKPGLIGRSGWDDCTPYICLEPPGTGIKMVDLLVACYVVKLWSETRTAVLGLGMGDDGN